jgi:hypothetical protein
MILRKDHGFLGALHISSSIGEVEVYAIVHGGNGKIM